MDGEIIVEDARLDNAACAICPEGEGSVRVILKSKVGKAFTVVLCQLCRLHLEGGLRQHRKFVVRGGRM